MAESVILSSPPLAAAFAAALALCVPDRLTTRTRGVCTLLGTVLAVLAAAAALILGASMWETAAALTAVLLATMGVKA